MPALTDWQESAEVPPLWSGALHIWQLALDDDEAPCGAAAGLLNEGERQRSERFLSPLDRRRWERSRAWLRRLLGLYLDTSAAAIEFALGPYGKPELHFPAMPPLHFNLSHSKCIALCGVSREGPLGVDVEELRDDLDLESIAALGFDQAGIAALGQATPSERPRRFAELWVRHEARLKCLGVGLSGAGLATDCPPCCADVAVGERYAAAYATSFTPTSVVLLRWSTMSP